MAGEKIIDGLSSKENVSDKHEWVNERVKTEITELKMDVVGFYESDPENSEKIKYNLDAVKNYLSELVKGMEGKQDKEAWQYLREKPSRSYARIMAVQIALESLGEGWNTDVNKIDGLLGGAGSHTRTAVKNFQDEYNKTHGNKLSPDGLPGRATIMALLEVMGGAVDVPERREETDKDKIEKVVLYEEVPLVKGEEITVDKLIKENPDGVEVKIAEGQDLTTNEVGEKIIKVELKSGEETDTREVKVKVVEQAEIDKYKLDRVVLHEEVPVVKGEEITVDKLIKENPVGVEVKIVEGQDLTTNEVGEKIIKVELKSGEETDTREVKVKIEEKVVEIAQNDDLDNIQLSDLGKWEGGEFKFNDGMLDEETGDLTINDKVFKKLEEGSDGFGYVKKEGLLSIGNFRGGFLNGKGVEFDDYGNEYRGEWKDGLLYNGVHVSEVEDVKFFYEVKEGKSVKCYVDDTLSIDMEKIGENVYLKYGENSLKLKNPYSAQVILKMLWDYKDEEGEFVSDFQQPNKLFRKGKDGNKKVVYNTVDGLIDSAVVPGGILAGWLNDYRQSEKEKIEDAKRARAEYEALCRKTELTDDEIKKVVKYENEDDEKLCLGLTSITDKQAEELGKLEMLPLDGLTSITDKQAEELGKVKVLYLNGLTSITDKQAEELGKVEMLFLDGLTSITDKQAEELGKVKVLYLNGLTSITDKQAEELGKAKELYLNGLTSITDKQAEELGKVKELSLNGLTSITDKQAEELGKVEILYIKEEILTPKQKQILNIS